MAQRAPQPARTHAAVTPRHRLRRFVPLVLGAILLVGAVLRGLYLWELAGTPDFARPTVDAGYHDYWARALASGDWTPPAGWGDPRMQTTPYLRPPGYPYFLALIYAGVGRSYFWARVAQMLLGLVNCILAWRFARRWYGDAVGLALAGLMSVYWIFIYYEGEFLEPVLLVTLSLLMLHGIGLWTQGLTLRRCLAAGVLLGLFALTRPNILVFVPVVVGWAFWITPRSCRRRLLLAVIVFPAGVLTAVAPATIRNYRVAHEFVPISSNGGINLFIGNNPSATGRFVYVPGLQEFQTCFDYAQASAYAESRSGMPLTHSGVSSYFARQALAFVREHPRRALQLLGTKALLFWGPVEVSNNKVVECDRDHSALLRWIPFRFPLALSLFVAGAALFTLDARKSRAPAADGMAPRPPGFQVGVLAGLFVVTYFASFLPFFAASHYRVPVIPFLLLFGAYAIVRFGEMVWSRSVRTVAVWLVVWACAWAAASVNFARERPDVPAWHYDRGAAYEAIGQPARAIDEYREALNTDPDYVPANASLGVALARRGESEQALTHAMTAARLWPRDYKVRCCLGQVLRLQKRPDEAMSEFTEALRLNPRGSLAHFELGILLRQRGRPADAVAHLTESLRGDPNNAEAYANLGLAYAVQGNVDAAIDAYRESLRIQPDVGVVHRNLAVVLYAMARYAEAWREVHLARKYGEQPHSDFLAMLAAKLPEPSE